MSSLLSIVIPAYNEETRLPATLDRIAGYLQSSAHDSFEILVVDDGSTDRTGDAAKGWGRQHSGLRVLHNPGNRGKGYSVRHGMLEAGGDWILFTDADLSAPIEELDKLFAAIGQTGAQIAIGSRAVDRSLIGVHQSAFRELSGRVFNIVMRAATGLPYQDTQCGFKLFSRQSARTIFERQRLDRFGFDVEALYIARRFGIRVIEVPVRWDHVEGSKVGLWQGINGFLDIARVLGNQWLGRYR